MRSMDQNVPDMGTILTFVEKGKLLRTEDEVDTTSIMAGADDN